MKGAIMGRASPKQPLRLVIQRSPYAGMTNGRDRESKEYEEIPAYAGMTVESAGMTGDADLRRDTNREIPAYAGMTGESAGMTGESAGMMGESAGMTESPTCRGDMLEYQGFEGSSTTTRNGTGAARAAFGEKAATVCNLSNGGAEANAEFDDIAGPT